MFKNRVLEWFRKYFMDCIVWVVGKVCKLGDEEEMLDGIEED